MIKKTEGLDKKDFDLIRKMAQSAIRRRGRSNSLELGDLWGVGWLALEDAKKRYRPEMGPLQNFAARRIRGELIDYIQKNRAYGSAAVDGKFRCGSGTYGSVQILDRPDNEIRPDQQIDQHRRRKRLQTAIKELPYAEKHVILRAYRDEKDQSSIARELDVTQGYVSRLRVSALQRMRPCMEGFSLAA